MINLRPCLLWCKTSKNGVPFCLSNKKDNQPLLQALEAQKNQNIHFLFLLCDKLFNAFQVLECRLDSHTTFIFMFTIWKSITRKHTPEIFDAQRGC